jgi:tetratricopeptide (TPR) repeat protein
MRDTLARKLSILAIAAILGLPALAQQQGGGAAKPADTPERPVIDYAAYRTRTETLMERVRAGEITAEAAIEAAEIAAGETNAVAGAKYESYTKPTTRGNMYLRARRFEEALPHYLEAQHASNLYSTYTALQNDEKALEWALKSFEVSKQAGKAESARRHLTGAIRLMHKLEQVNVNEVLDLYKELYLAGIATPEEAMATWREMYLLCRQTAAPDRQKQLEVVNVILRLFPPPPAEGESAAMVEERWRGITSVAKRMQRELQAQLLNEPE